MAQPALTPRGERGERGRARQAVRCRRRGLAPIELVLWTPILLFVMALMVNYGTAAAWRLRGEVIARDAVWRTRWPRTSGDELPPQPPVWPTNATQALGAGPPVDVLDLPQLHLGPTPNGFQVRPVLDPTRGAEEGSASIKRRYPLLPRLGSFSSGVILHPLIDRPWTCDDMGIPNTYRRILVLYLLPKTDPSLPAAYSQAAQDLLGIPHFDALSILENNHDWQRYQPWHGRSMPDFHPQVNAGRCELDRSVVYRTEVQRLVDVRQPNGQWRLGQISLLPRTLTRAYLSMYEATKKAMEAELNSVPPPPPARIAFLQSEIAYIDQQIDPLKQFQTRIAGFENQLRNRP